VGAVAEYRPRIFSEWVWNVVELATHGMQRCALSVATRRGEEGAPLNDQRRTARAEI
jgi:hypothetical protein